VCPFLGKNAHPARAVLLRVSFPRAPWACGAKRSLTPGGARVPPQTPVVCVAAWRRRRVCSRVRGNGPRRERTRGWVLAPLVFPPAPLRPSSRSCLRSGGTARGSATAPGHPSGSYTVRPQCRAQHNGSRARTAQVDRLVQMKSAQAQCVQRW
jgi:hypothetical protein